MTELQKSMYANYRRPLVNWKALALVALGFVLYPALTLFLCPFFRREAHGGKIPLYDSRLQRQAPACNDTWLLIFFDNTRPHAEPLNKTEVSRETLTIFKLHSLGSCGDVRLPARKGEGHANNVSRDPGFVLPEQFPTYRGTTPREMRTGRIAEATFDHDLRPMPSE